MLLGTASKLKPNRSVDEVIPWDDIEHFITSNTTACDSFYSSIGLDDTVGVANTDNRLSLNSKCPICLISTCYVPRVTKCGHVFW